MTTYRKNYISQAVLEITFDSIATQKFLGFLGKNVEKNGFGHRWNQQEIRQENIEVTDNSFSRRTDTGIIWFCDDLDGKKIRITPTSLTVLFDKEKYKNQTIFSTEFEFIEEFLKFYEIKYLNTFSLRYINEFIGSDFDDVEDGNWGNYINSNYLSNIIVGKNIGDIRQTLCDTTIGIDDYFVRLRYGIRNKYVPNPIIDWDYILDISIFSKNPIETEGLKLGDLFKKYKESLNKTFENSITDNLRNILEPIDE